MRLWKRAGAWFEATLGRSRMEREMDAELRFHLEARVADLVCGGMKREEAKRRAQMEFGSFERAKEECRAVRGVNFIDSLVQDVRYSLRMLRKSPGFTCVAVLTLALGIGANTVVFGVVNALLLRPLPVERPSELAFLENNHYGAGQSFPNYQDLRDRNRTFAGLAGYRASPMELEANAGAERIWGYLATGNYFAVLGVKATVGRFFEQSDDLHPGASPYAVLSYSAWLTRFAADPSIVGKTIRINRLPYTVLGVAPKDFHGTELLYWPEVWVPMMMEPQIERQNPWLDNRNTWNTWVIGRLQRNVSSRQAEADLNGIATELARRYPLEDEALHFKLAKPGLVGDLLGDPARAFSLGVLALGGLVLLAACTNLASLLMARATDRQRELAIRLAIGAGRGRVRRQILTETLVLSLAGGGAGFVLAECVSQALNRLRAPIDFPFQYSANPDWRVFLFALVVSIITGGLFGAAPAWRASTAKPDSVIKQAPGSCRGSHLALRDALVVVQVALCSVLVCACLLSLRGLRQSLKMNLGFEPQQVSVVAFELGLAGYSEEQGQAFQKRALQATEQLPGVRSASFSNSLPLSIDQSHTDMIVPADETEIPSNERVSVNAYQVSPQFFATMGTKLLAGRDFSWHDGAKAPQVAIVNVAFGKAVLHTDNPVGKRFRNGPGSPAVEVVGVVEDGKYESLTESRAPAVFWPILQQYNSTTTLEVRSARPATEMVGEMRRAISRLDPELPVYGAGSLGEMLGFAYFPTRAAAIALSAFGVLAIILAATGIHGLVAYTVSRRTHEIGIRMALGARHTQVLRLVLTRTAALLALGSVFGAILVVAMGRVMATIVYEVESRDPLVMIGVFLTMALLGLSASWSPARRATRVDPIVALRYE